ncbi:MULTISPECIES: VpsF family polysaccharide biosynthesis protein [unclassified Beijerinckia]|uniref:VpsF family polysaccharide biosynthesis protein n=1 Tax=unclassified Beijerinckia TaxID=2638183 RepID=UPI000895BB04|nr:MULTISPECIES: VpsF family polysaccharide biosynthesis protein [unclassified Beijerinckia]MDH7794162.1 hypothetical protein [Beijerinckia sp. GAS462]SEB54700.1 hypothetical protein SAMN05443249_0427 [Beijerinckia sp. 28-YEA-48]
MRIERAALEQSASAPGRGAGWSAPAAEEAGLPRFFGLARAAFVVFCIAIVLRVMIGDGILNLVERYTSEGGSLIEKIHPAVYVMLLCGFVIYATVGLRFLPQERPEVRAFLMLAGLLALIGTINILVGRGSSAGYVIDSYITTLLIAVLLYAMPHSWRGTVGLLVIGAIAFNSAFMMLEFGLGRTLVPAAMEAAEFRPAGFLGTPLTVGVLNLATAILVVSLPINTLIKAGTIALLVLGILIAGARTAMLLTSVVIPVALVLAAWQRRSGMSAGVTAVTILLVAIIAGPLIFVAANELGFLARFQSGYIDDSAQTRIEIYRVFDYVSWKEILFGSDLLTLKKIVNDKLGIQFIESAIVFFIFDFGLIGFIAFSILFGWLLYVLSRGSHILLPLATLCFLGLALTNNTLATKVPSLFAMLVMLIGVRAIHLRSDRGQLD